MSPNKRKICEDTSEDEHHCSSLRVNLSFNENFSDSGNGSLKTIPTESLNTLPSSVVQRRRSAKTRAASQIQNATTTNEGIIRRFKSTFKDVHLKDVNVVLEDISKVDKSLNVSCNRLKDAILKKTREIFDEENELSARTSVALGNRSNVKKCTVSDENAALDDILLKSNTRTNNSKDPSNSKALNNSKRVSNKEYKQSKDVHQKKCFSNTNVSDKGDTYLGNQMLRSPVSSPTSPVLAGSCKMLNRITSLSQNLDGLSIKNKSRRLNFQSANDNNKSLTHSLGTSAIEDESMYRVAPVASSTICEAFTDSNNSLSFRKKTTITEQQLKTKTKRDLLSMEMTDARGGFIIESSTVLNTSNDIDRSLHVHRNHSADKSNFIAKHISVEDDINDSEKANVLQGNVSRRRDPVDQIDNDDSLRSIQSSMHVNTSIDISNNNNLEDTDEERVIEEDEVHKSKESSLIQEQQEQGSVNTVATSLQMNTSLTTVHRLSLRRIGDKNRSSSTNSTGEYNSVCNTNQNDKENVSLSERLKDVQITCSVTESINANHDNRSCEQQESVESDVILSNKSKQHMMETINGSSLIQPTPYPPSRSVLLRSQIRQHTHTYNLQNKNCSYNINLSSRSKTSTNRQRNVDGDNSNNSIISLKDSVICEERSAASLNTVIIPDSDNDKSGNVQNANERKTDTSAEQKGTKRKLLPLHESSQPVSLTPIPDQVIIPNPPLMGRRRKKFAIKLGKRKAIRNETATNGDMSCIENNYIDGKKKDKTSKPRRIISKKITIKKIRNSNILRALDDTQRQNVLSSESSPCSRSSLNVFQNKKVSDTQVAKGISQRIIIVATGLSRDDKNLVKSVTKSLGKAKVEQNVSRRTTHVVTTGVRTINLLHGIIRGCWLVSIDWVLKSLESNQWLYPEEYEMAHFSKAVMENRKDRQLFGMSYIPDLFTTTGLIYVETGTSPPCNALKDLIKAAGGRITEDPEAAKIIIGSQGLRENWVLDCITTGELQSHAHYKHT